MKRKIRKFYRRHRTTIWGVALIALFFASYAAVGNADYHDCLERSIC